MLPLRATGWAGALLLSLGLGSWPAVVPLAPAGAVELRGSTYFASPPWKAEWITYTSNVGQGNAEHFLTVALPEAAGVGLGQLGFGQIRGVDTDFLSRINRVRAFIGRPRREGAPIPVQAAFDAGSGQWRVLLLEPVPPGTTVTVALQAWRNPLWSDTYLFQVVAWPAGADPMPSPVGVATLRIYDPFDWR
ncbi:MAG: DUF2808 domain-containing protein [Cyanobium sp.]